MLVLLSFVWTILVAMFFGFSTALVVIARADRIEAEHLDGDTLFIVETRERRAVIRLLGWAALLVVGIVSLIPFDQYPRSSITTAGLFIGIIALGLEDTIELIDRIRFRRRKLNGKDRDNSGHR